MAIDYLTALKDFASKGGTDINEFLKQHTIAQPDGALTPSQPSSVAARLAAADSRDRLLGQGAPIGNIITNPTLRPVTAQSNALQAKLNARAAGTGTVVQPATEQPIADVFSPTPRRVAPAFDTAVATPQATTNQPAAPDVPWWQRSSFAGDPGFDKYVNENIALSRRPVRSPRGGVNYNPSSTL